MCSHAGGKLRAFAFVFSLTIAAAWEEKRGHISGDDPTLAEMEMTVEEAKSLCDAMDDCHTITMEQAPSSPDEKVMIYLKSSTHVVESDWTSYVYTERISGQSPAQKHTESQLKQVMEKMGLWWVGSNGDSRGFLARKPNVVSEPEFADDELYSGAVLNLVGSTLLNVTRDPTKDVVVNYFATCCGPGQKFKPQWAQFAAKLKHVKTLVFASMDSTLNSVPEEPIHSFPTIRFYPAKNKDNVPQWWGARDPDRMMEWLQTHASFKFSAEPPKEDDAETVLLMQGAGRGLSDDDL
jgi:thiol-disulfide isomerase/thioredoxin